LFIAALPASPAVFPELQVRRGEDRARTSLRATSSVALQDAEQELVELRAVLAGPAGLPGLACPEPCG